ncbi:MAG: hypothetical protein Q7J80_05055, partial [Anaerolineales bacterium]|nr:hypothetical protein [Anaerolineales bacterium]
MNEIKRAQNIIQAYAKDLEGLTVEECAAEGFSPGQCKVLVQALGKGAEGKITATDEFVLKSRHFSKE